MRLFLVQHGEAKTEEEDPDRPLTEIGIREATQVARAAAAAGIVTAGRIVHSGKTRARHTAEIWGAVLSVPLEQAEQLAPLDDPHIWATRVTTEPSDLMIVGHMPHLARMAGFLLAGDPGRAVIAFENGGLVGLDRGDAGWSASLVMPPAAVAAPPQAT
jgi:phosphohistidine phosphatase